MIRPRSTKAPPSCACSGSWARASTCTAPTATRGQSGTLAYYDTKTEEIYVRGDVMDAADRVTVADELTHVLQDQNFDLSALDERAATSESGDFSALRALVEGDATRIEDEYIARLSDADKAEYDAEMAAQRERFGGETADVPEILLFQLGAPYTYGPYTVRVLLANGGNAAVDAALTGPTPSARMFLEPAELEAGSAAEPIVPQGSEALGPPMNFTAFDVYVMLAARADAYAALRAADEVSGGKYVTYQAPGGPYCVQASLATRSVAGRATLVSALQGWAATMPGAVVADVGDAVRVTSCDPGAQSTAPDDAQIQRSEQLLALRGELTAGLAENDVAPDDGTLRGTARCKPARPLRDLLPRSAHARAATDARRSRRVRHERVSGESGVRPLRLSAPPACRPIGITIGVPATGSGTTRAARSNTSATSASVTTSAGGPSATIAPALHRDEVVGVAARLVQVVQHEHDRAPARWLRSTSRSSTSTWWARSRYVVGSSSSSSSVPCASAIAIQTRCR